MLTEKDDGESGNMDNIRRIYDGFRSTKSTKQTSKLRQVVTAEKVPEHLKNLLDSAPNDRTVRGNQRIAYMLVIHQNAFSQHEYGLGCSKVGEQCIDIGDQKPSKQAPI